MDGGSRSLRVLAGGRTHGVTTYYYIVNRFNRLADLLLEICRPAREAAVGEKDARSRMMAEEEDE